MRQQIQFNRLFSLKWVHKHYMVDFTMEFQLFYNSKDEFLKGFLNQFEFTRYNKNESLRNNEEFKKM